MNKCLFLLFAILSMASSLYAQDREPLEVKFGRLLPGERELMPTGRDSAAAAYVLYDQEHLRMTMTSDGKPQLLREVHRRVKLIRESSFDLADVEVGYATDHQALVKIDAAVHLPGGGGDQVEKERHDQRAGQRRLQGHEVDLPQRNRRRYHRIQVHQA